MRQHILIKPTYLFRIIKKNRRTLSKRYGPVIVHEVTAVHRGLKNTHKYEAVKDE